MLLPKDQLRHLSCVAHEGKIMTVATDGEGRLFYTIRQDGFEDSYLNTPPEQRTGWEAWQRIELPNEADDPSVLELEKAEMTYVGKPDSYVLRSRYRTMDQSAVAPVQLISALGHVYVFRQSREGTLLVDRFVLDGMTNKLTRKLEVRYRRSRQRNKPSENMKMGSGGLTGVDTLDFRDTNEDFFYEPTIELCAVSNLQSGWFSVVLVPTNEHEKCRWHFFFHNSQTQKVELLSLRTSEDGLFDVKDSTVFEPRSASDDTLCPRVIPGLIRRELELPGAVVTNGLSATRYDLQQERQVANGRETQLLRTDSRLMLAIPTDKGTAALSFGIAADGTLSQLVATAESVIVRSTERDVLLPLNTLEQLKAFADATPPPQGSITGVRLGTDGEDAADKVIVTSDQAGSLGNGDVVKVTGTNPIDGVYQVTKVAASTFELQSPQVAKATRLGQWEKQEDEEGGLYFDGMVTAYERTPDGKLMVSARNHGLVSGDEIQIIGTRSQDGVYPVSKLDEQNFIIDRLWNAAEVLNIRLESRKRRGVVFDGVDDYIALPPRSLPKGNELSICFWAKGGPSLPKGTRAISARAKDGTPCLRINLPWADGKVYFGCGQDFSRSDLLIKQATDAEFKETWAHWAFTKSAQSGEMKIYRNGQLWHSGTGMTQPVGEATNLAIGRNTESADQHYDGTLAELTIWARTLSEAEIRNGMYLPRNGKEAGLCGYWPLGSIIEGTERKVIDLAAGNDGVVMGGAYVGAMTLGRTLRDGSLAVKYVNSELIAVSQRATYREEFEFRVNATPPLTLAKLANIDGAGNPIFKMSVWGRRNRSAADNIPIDVKEEPWKELGGGWYAASGSFIVPDSVSTLRSFELAKVKGNFTSLEIRKHRLRRISDSITSSTCKESVNLSPLPDTSATLDQKLRTLGAKQFLEKQLVKEKAQLEEKLELYQQQESNKSVIQALEPEVERLRRETQSLSQAYQDELNSPMNYVCYLFIKVGTDWKGVHVRDPLATEADLIRIQDQGNPVKFTNDGNGTFRLQIQAGGTWKGVHVQGQNFNNGALLVANAAIPGNLFKVNLLGGTQYSLWSYVAVPRLPPIPMFGDVGPKDEDWKGSHIWLQSNADNTQIVRHAGAGNEIDLRRTDEFANTRIEDARKAWEAKRDLYTARLKVLDALRPLLQATDADKAAWQARLQQVTDLLQKLQTELGVLNSDFVNSVRTTPLAAQSMPLLAKDARGLSISGALLPFVRPTSRLTAMETCEGNVQLSYFDDRGRMRQTLYDACADSRNNAFEQWLPEAQRTCVNLASNQAVLQPKTPIALGESWSIEAWFEYPLPPREWNSLTSSSDGEDSLIVALRGQYLGLRRSGFFFNSGYQLGNLSVGWHHLCAVKRGTGMQASVTFYIDGQRMAQVMAPPKKILALDGVNDHAELPVTCLPIGREITISFWARTGGRSGAQDALLLEAVDNAKQRVLAIGLPDASGKVFFECGGGVSGVDRIEIAAATADLEDRWTHWVFTKHPGLGLMRIYRNGKLCAEAKSKTKFLTAASTLVIGKAAATDSQRFCGYLAELSIFSREVSAIELADRIGIPWTGREPGLCGYFLFSGSRAKDVSANANDGTLIGGPPLLDMAIGDGHQIALIGNYHGTETRQVTEEVVTSVQAPALSFDGVDDMVEFPSPCFPVNTDITVSFWARGGTTLPRQSTILEVYGARSCYLTINLPWDNSFIDFDFGIVGALDRIEKAASAAEYRGSWAHWAFTRNAKTKNMTIYRNGVKWHSGTGKAIQRSPQPVASKVVLGRAAMQAASYYQGDVAELSIWNRELTDTQVQGLMNRPLDPTEAGLFAYWKFEATQATDQTGAGRHGKYTGNPTLLTSNTVPLKTRTQRTQVIGGGGEDQSFGKLCEVRVFGVALTDDEVAAHSKVLLSGNEPGLSAYYPMNEAGGNVMKDLSANSNDATSTSNREPLVMNFNGVNDSIFAADHPSLQIKTYSVEVWVRPTRNPNQEWMGIVGKPGRAFHIWLQGSGSFVHHRFHTQANANDGAPDTPNGSVKWDQWNHIAITNDGAKARTYINGELAAEGPVASPVVVDSSPLIIGRNMNGQSDRYFQGRMAELRIFNRARTQDEIKADLHQRLFGKESGLVAYLPLNGIKVVGQERRAVDVTGNINAVITEATTAIDNILPLGMDHQLDETLWVGCPAPIGHPGHRTLSFDGKNDHVSLPAMSLDSSQGLSFEAWVRWNSFKPSSRVLEFGNGPAADNVALFNADTSPHLILSVYKGNKQSILQAQNVLELGQWIHVAATLDTQGNATLYKNGQAVQTGKVATPNILGRSKNYLGRSNWDTDGNFDGQLAEVRIWNKVKSPAEIRMGRHQRLSGKEEALLGYWPLDAIVPMDTTSQVLDLSPGGRHGTVTEALIVEDAMLPIAADALISAEYSTISTDPKSQRKLAIMRRFLAAPSTRGALLLPDKRIESLDLKWIGNAQFAPTLLGFIEGAPPIPSENLTEGSDYKGATSVELSTSQDVEFQWNRSQDVGGGMSYDTFIGAETEVNVGLGVTNKTADIRVGFKGSFDQASQRQTETNIRASSSQRLTDRLELRGSPELQPKFRHLGRRFIPKNVGYALVISGIADTFVTRLSRSGKMVGYQVLPVEGIPPDVNTITFMINPAYVMQGSLDGLTGSQPTSDRFFKYVPEMRSQFGALYPASYYRLHEAYDLKRQIENDDKRRESYFAQFNAQKVREEDLIREIDKGPAVEDLTVNRAEDAPKPGPASDRQPTDAAQKKAAASSGAHSQAVTRKQAEINAQAADQDRRVHAQASFEGWQKRMEDILLKAGKRNIVNTYVWDADGGLRTEVQSFASTAEQSIGGSFTMDASFGAEGELGLFGAKAELTALATINLTQTMRKTDSRTTGLELNVDLSGVESTGITDYNDQPLLPGEKVDRYRFMSFYLAASTRNYYDFFRYVVDPEWLQSNGEEARALRQAMGKANKAWRVLHRVTYVERPALMGFGRDLRQVESDYPITDAVVGFLQDLSQRQRGLEVKVEKLQADLTDLIAQLKKS